MRSIFLAFVILIAPLVSVAQTVTYQLRGFTSTTVLGDHGVLEMTRQCAVEFGDVGATRMCTSSEILNTATVPQGLVGEAWVRPSWQPFAAAEVAGSPQGLDDSGRYDNPTRLSCHGWSFGSNGNSYGLAVDGTGSFLNPSSCNTPLAIACCHPVVVPEPSASLGLSTGVFALLALHAVRG